jgi:cholesterol oxidase
MAGHYDVVIIGSGYGASVCAARLARAGKRVCVLERGREVSPGGFPRDPVSFAASAQVEHARGRVGHKSALFRFVMDDDVGATMGCGLGGTSLINAGVALRPDPAVWDEPRWPAALRADVEGREEAFARAEAMLRPAPYPERTAQGAPMPTLPKLDALEAAARAMGKPETFCRVPLTVAFEATTSAAGVAQPACALCGDCLTGCNTGAKTTLLTTYLADAAAHGAELYTEIDVRRVEAQRRGYNVYFEPTALHRERFDAPPLHVHGDVVILGAGAIGSSEILLRSRAAGLPVSNQLGKRFSGNATTIAFGHQVSVNVHAVGGAPDGVVGPAIAGMITARDADGQPMVIQETAIPRPLTTVVSNILRWSGTLSASSGSPLTGRRSLRLLRENTQCYAVTARDDAGGRVSVEDGRVRLRWPGAGLQPVVSAIHEELRTVTAALGGRLVANPAWENLPKQPPMTTHPLGGCAMAEDGKSGVTDHRGRVFRGDGPEVHEALLVCDGSVLPGALGCNPLLTISALAERAVALLLRDYPSTASERPMVRHPVVANHASELQFTERMTGTWNHPGGAHFSFVCTLLWPSLGALLADPAVHARSVGTLEAPALSPDPLTVVRGHFQLLVPWEDGSRRMIHQLTVRDRQGRTWFVDGYKTIGRDRGRGLWPDTTTLYFTVHEGETSASPSIGEGSVEVRLDDLWKQVSTMRGGAANRRGPLASVRATGKFLRMFASDMLDTYVVPSLGGRKPRSAPPSAS